MGEETEGNLPSDNILDALNGSMQNIKISDKAADITKGCLLYREVIFEIDVKRA
jgi:hypothetical protein